MRLARVKGPPQGTSLLVAEVPPPMETVAPSTEHLESFSAEYQRMHAPLVSYAKRFVGPDDALDAVGDTWEAMWVRWPMVVRERRGDGYYYSAVHYTVNAMLEANDRFVSLDDAEEELDQQAFEAAPRPTRGETKSELIAAAIAALPPQRRAVILLLKEQDLTYAEAAEVLGVSIGTINSHVYWANADIKASVTRATNQMGTRETPRLPAPKGGDSND